MNDEGTRVRYEIVDRDGTTLGPFDSIAEAAAVATNLLGGQDEDRTGDGWDIQVVA